MITRKQMRVARTALGWSLKDLSKSAGVGSNTINRYENGSDMLGENLKKIQAALEAEGIGFTGDKGRHGITWPAD